MRFSILYASMAVYFALASASNEHQIYGRQEDDSSEFHRGFAYLWQMCSPDSYRVITNSSYDGQIFPQLASSPFPCDQVDYILGTCMTNATNPAVDLPAEQRCLCGSNLVDAWKGCQACYYAHGARLTNEIEEASYISSVFTAECTPSPYPSVPLISLLNITTPTTTAPRPTFAEDKFPDQTAASNYWTTNAHLSPTIGVITGIATGTVSTSSGTGVVTSSAGTTPAPSGSASGSAAGASTSLSTAGAGDIGVASGVVMIFVNLVAVMLL
ncbi:hypothetical protein BKA64DRAFT_742158 [Cadophora sp. MPI-SDFR-AT-0126]|nr:hypothetical protein BKA64DRAFT_742158 [Leotiomycetes sp. MPI-SDFR-AT-0126]